MSNEDATFEDRVRAYAEQIGADPEAFVARVVRRRDYWLARASRPFKRCSVCQRKLPARAFAEDASRRDGLQRICRECNANRLRARRATPTLAHKKE